MEDVSGGVISLCVDRRVRRRAVPAMTVGTVQDFANQLADSITRQSS
jgi:hypothetical protein